MKTTKAPQMNTEKYVTEATFNQFLNNDFKELKENVTENNTHFSEFREFVIENTGTKKEIAILNNKIDNLDVKVDHIHSELMTGMDLIVKTLQDMREEFASQSYTNKRHETWIKDLANHTHYTLSPDA